MKIGITGATGFIGQCLCAFAIAAGHQIVIFTRRPGKLRDETRKFSTDGSMDVSGCDAIVHLAGESIFGFWTANKKYRIWQSRIDGTRALVDAIARAESPPRVLVSGSAVGYYGDTRERATDEGSPAGEGFLADTCVRWEAEAARAAEYGTRVAFLRTAIVLGCGGGALRMMLPIFRAGLGGRIGPGWQWMSWIHIEDMARLILYIIKQEAIFGPINAAAPKPVRNIEFTHTLADTLHRRAPLAVPEMLLRKILREAADELLVSKRVIPRYALDAGFPYRYPTLSVALDDLVGAH
jgi:uncharacterized protein (TIGR01777 family)